MKKDMYTPFDSFIFQKIKKPMHLNNKTDKKKKKTADLNRKVSKECIAIGDSHGKNSIITYIRERRSNPQ